MSSRETLRLMREKNSPDSELIIKLAEPLLKSSASSMGDEAWVVYEQACLAALDCNRDELAKECHAKLEARFGDESTRVGLLAGMISEAGEKWEEAEEHYAKLIERDDTSGAAMKRLIAVKIAQHKNIEAIAKLNKYLENFMGDFEAWMELASLYLQENQFVGAQFCFEELILSNPYNNVFHQRYAEILFTIGGSDNLELAQKHFAQAVKLNPKSARALFGLYLVVKKTTKPGSASAPMAELCEKTLKTLHKGTPTAAIVDGLFKTMSA